MFRTFSAKNRETKDRLKKMMTDTLKEKNIPNWEQKLDEKVGKKMVQLWEQNWEKSRKYLFMNGMNVC